MRTAIVSCLRFALFGLALLASAKICEGSPNSVSQALIWLPSGVAIAGTWLLGLPAAGVVALATLWHRVNLSYDPTVWLPAMAGSAAEAIVGVLLLRRLQVRGTFTELREVWSLLLMATIAPLASLLGSMIGRSLPGVFTDFPFHSEWIAWWRMNMLGALITVPFALLWLGKERRPTRREALLHVPVVVATIGLVAFVMLALEPGSTSMLLLTMLLPVALFAGIHLGPRGAVTTGTVGAVTIMWFAAHGTGGFQAIPFTERHTTAQIFLVALVSVPLVFGALIAERQAVLTRAMQREGLHQALIEVMPDAVYRLRRDDTVVHVVAPKSFPMVTPAEQLIGRRLTDLFAPDLAKQLLLQVDNARNGRPVSPVEYQVANKLADREVRYVPLLEGEVLGVVRDVTARKQAERQLLWQAEILESIAAGRPTATVMAAIVAGIERFLPGCRASLLLVQGKHLRLSCAPSMPAEFNAAVDKMLIGVGNGTCGTAAATGERVVVSDVEKDALCQRFLSLLLPHQLRACWSVPMRNAERLVLGTFAVYHAAPRSPSQPEIELVERAALLATLAIERERREELLASIQENVSEGLFRRTPGSGLLYANAACARLFGYDSAVHLLAAANAAPTSGDDARHRESLQWLATTFTATHHEERELHRRDGVPFLAVCSTTLVTDSGGTVTACDGAIADITASKQMAEQLRQSQKMETVGHLAGGIAHDFNNLLTAIGGYAECLRSGLPNDDPLCADANEILRATQRAAELTRQLLAFGRRQVLTPRVLDLGAAVEQMLGMLRRLIGERIVLSTVHAAKRACARVDQGQLEQVLLNLVLNARDAMPNGGSVTIKIDSIVVHAAEGQAADLAPGRYATISITDTGCGMSPEVRTRAFDPFFTTKPIGHGTGLGLSMVYGIVKQSGGNVVLDSMLDRGTTVAVQLPQVDAHPEPARTVLLPRPRGRAGKILVVEDEPLVRELLHRALLRAGHTVIIADDGKAALDLATSHRDLDAVVTDVVMPQLGGRELISRLRVDRPELPVLFVSGYSTHGESLLHNMHGRVAVLSKPFTAAQLHQALDPLLPGAEPLPVG